MTWLFFTNVISQHKNVAGRTRYIQVFILHLQVFLFFSRKFMHKAKPTLSHHPSNIKRMWWDGMMMMRMATFSCGSGGGCWKVCGVSIIIKLLRTWWWRGLSLDFRQKITSHLCAYVNTQLNTHTVHNFMQQRSAHRIMSWYIIWTNGEKKLLKYCINSLVCFNNIFLTISKSVQMHEKYACVFW